MKAISPKFARTTIGNAAWEWIPASFEEFLEEAEHVQSHCRQLDHLALYRGHRERKWLLDSTFARWCKQQVFGIEPWQRIDHDEFRLSTNHQQILLNLFFLKFDFLVRPSDELFELEDQLGIDPWFELMKRIQQYPEEDHPHLKGSFVLDWTRIMDVAIYFANGSKNDEGALWIVDATATGKTLQVIKVGEILRNMDQLGRSHNSLGAPLLFYPKKQIMQARAKNQDPVYIAQMELRIDLSEVWANSNRPDEQIFIKVILTADTNDECRQYLDQKGLTREYIFPD